MAGSYRHMITGTGKLRNSRGLRESLEHNSGDVNEALAECYGMIWWLASVLARTPQHGWGDNPPRHVVQAFINEAREHYADGVKAGGRER
jgi:hypothetical protein